MITADNVVLYLQVYETGEIDVETTLCDKVRVDTCVLLEASNMPWSIVYVPCSEVVISPVMSPPLQDKVCCWLIPESVHVNVAVSADETTVSPVISIAEK